MKVIFVSFAIMLIVLITISSCGRKGDPIPPDKINIDMSRGERR